MPLSGVKDYKYYASEIDKFAIKCTQYNYPNTIQIGDIQSINYNDYEEIDLIMGGSPCQGFSNAGHGKGFDDERSKLVIDFIDLIKNIKPRYYLLENVSMSKENQDIINNLIGVEPITINSNLVSAQNRKRLYWTNIPFNINNIQDKQILFNEIKELYIKDKSVYYSNTNMNYFTRNGTKRKTKLKILGDNKVNCVTASYSKGYSNTNFFAVPDNPLNDLGEEYNYSLLEKQQIWSLPEHYYRFITPLECERAQTIPDGYTSILSKTQRYKTLGNSWTVDVIVEILKGMNL